MKLPVLDWLSALVAIPSVSGDEDAAAAWAEAILSEHGLETRRVGNSVVARVRRGRGPRFLLHSHLDTVPVGPGWTRDPYAGRWDGVKLYGRGANDAKASAVAMAAGLVEFSELGGAEGEAILALTACEETSNSGMTDVLAALGLPDGAVAGEPTGLEVVRAQSGLAVLTARWAGTPCHAAHAARLAPKNALLEACRELSATAPHLTLAGAHPLLGESTAVATMLTAGERANVVPGAAEAVFDARLSPLHRAADVVRLLTERMPAAEVAVRSERLTPVETAEDHPLVQAALAAAGRTRAIGSRTLSDMALLRGVPAVKVGPGLTERSHTPDEFVLAEEVEAGAAFYARLVPAALAALAAAGVKS